MVIEAEHSLLGVDRCRQEARADSDGTQLDVIDRNCDRLSWRQRSLEQDHPAIDINCDGRGDRRLDRHG